MSNNDNIQIVNKGIGYFGLLGLLFIGLKLGGVIDWSWFWVLSPIVIPFGIKLFFLLLLTTVMIVGFVKGYEKKK